MEVWEWHNADSDMNMVKLTPERKKLSDAWHPLTSGTTCYVLKAIIFIATSKRTGYGALTYNRQIEPRIEQPPSGKHGPDGGKLI